MKIRVANAPCSWGVLEFEGMAKTAEWTKVLDEMEQAGYAGTELGDLGFLPSEARALNAALASRGLSMLGGFVPVRLSDPTAHESGVARAIEVARLLAQIAPKAFIVLSDDNGSDPLRRARAGRIRPEDGLDEQGWRTFSAGVEHIARRIRDDTGLRCVFHHHGAGFIETPDEVDRLMSSTDPELVGLCLDTGHYMFGGGDPLRALARYRDRIWHVHFKDFDPSALRADPQDYFEAVGRGVFCELGRGVVPFEKLVRSLESGHYEGWIVVEQDVLPGMGAPLESAKRNRMFLEGLGL